ncbi:MAG TPA: hypothetical protein VGE52_11020 [Pirellulales bacterium]
MNAPVKDSADANRPETILQFGAGRFLRGFVDYFVQQANDAGQNVGRVVIVQTTGSDRADAMNSRTSGGYHVLLRGVDRGRKFDECHTVKSVSRAISANSQWNDVVAAFCSPHIKWVVSNTTEAGYALDAADRPDDAPPKSFPAKLTALLWERFQRGGESLTIVPCELIERNADKLRSLVLDLAVAWGKPTEFHHWLTSEVLWLENLVDRMVTAPSSPHAEAGDDPLVVQVEPFALWAIKRPTPGWSWPWPHPAIEVVDELSPYYLRKVRILNGLHSAMVAKFRPLGFETVQQVAGDEAAMEWLLGLLYEEIVPTIAHRADDVAKFARQTLDRYANPFLAHKLSDIALNHEAKVAVRLRPTYDEYTSLFGKHPKRLSEILTH